MKSLVEVQEYINSFNKPEGYSDYAWNRAKSMAYEVWYSYLNGRIFRKPINFFCNEFYDMIRTPDGEFIVPENSFKRFAA